MKRLLITFLMLIASGAGAQVPALSSFSIRPFDENQFYTFVKVFSDMRGPLRSEILKDHKDDFKSADPLKYVTKVKDDAQVQSTLKANSLTWDQFTGLMGNIVLAYLSTQPQATKSVLIQKLADYGLGLSDSQIPAQYRDQIKSLFTSPEGAALAGLVLDQVMQIPEQNTSIVKKKSRTLDQLFYTRFWRDKI